MLVQGNRCLGVKVKVGTIRRWSTVEAREAGERPWFPSTYVPRFVSPFILPFEPMIP